MCGKMLKITEERIDPFVRCVGRGTALRQRGTYCSYDYRMIYLVNGTGTILHNEDEYAAEAGDLFVFAPGTRFSVRCGPAQTCIVVNFDWTQGHAEIRSPVLSAEAEDFAGDRVIEKVDLSAFGEEDGMIRVKGFFEAEGLLNGLYKVYFADVRPNRVWMSGLLKQLIGMLMQRMQRAWKRDEKAQLLAGRVIAYVQEKYAQRLTLEGIARHFHYHPTYINRVMNAVVGVSFHQYLLDYRLRQSLPLLEMESLSVEEIAARTGFSNSKHFSTSFRKHFGIAPSRYALCRI